jgi:hypothetical protein
MCQGSCAVSTIHTALEMDSLECSRHAIPDPFILIDFIVTDRFTNASS